MRYRLNPFTGTFDLVDGTLVGLGDPNADRIVFWDDSAGVFAFLDLGNSLTITGTTLNTIQDIATTSSPTFATPTVTGITIGANTLNTSEWAFLDGQDQAVKTVSSPTFANITDSGLTSGRVTYGSTAGLLVDSANLTFDGSLETLIAAGLGVTQTDTKGFLLNNTTAAALNAQQISPALRFRGQGWKTNATAASQSVDFRSYVLPVQGAANPTGKLTFESSINGAAYSTLMKLSSTGELDVSGLTLGITSSGTIEVTAAGGTNFRDLVTFFGGVEFGSDILFIRTSDTTFIIQDDIAPTVYFKVDTDAMSSTAGVEVLNLQITNDGTYGNVLSGTYTPSLTNTTNVAASTARLATYMRVGNTVTVAGQLDIDPTAAGAVLLGISLPVASNFSTVYQLGGVGSTIAITNESYGIEADATNDRASMKNIAVSTANHTVAYQFSYQVI